MTTHRPTTVSIQQRGFSLFELMAVLAMIATMLALVIPSLTVASRNYKLRAFAREIEGQLRNARFTAINRNRAASVIFSSDNAWYFLDTNGNGSPDSEEPSYWAPTGGYTLNVTAPSTALTSSVLGSTTNPAVLPNRGVSFSPRGSVNQVNSSQAATTTRLAAPGVIYLKDAFNNYAAVTITSAGRIRSWTLSGTTWR